MAKLQPLEYRVLRNVRDDDAFWTSDIAYDAGLHTTTCRSILKDLEAAGLVERVIKGNPISWRRSTAGRAALAQESKPEPSP